MTKGNKTKTLRHKKHQRIEREYQLYGRERQKQNGKERRTDGEKEEDIGSRSRNYEKQ